jgi:hypothetical protein
VSPRVQRVALLHVEVTMITCDEVREHLTKTGQYAPRCCDSCHEDAQMRPDEYWEMSSVYCDDQIVAIVCCTLHDDAVALVRLRRTAAGVGDF